ncbi:hypothetical protein K402DRAFT_446383 [Aulographum hederae CBS 113979]|uniref:Uncharacterized protein n=1 Tax=Aulographum hederae CBS 113979 TaxID=1176131 RepID=A0A6G1H1F8_9PEZI|nr:hypothetical protein K402DRAFT_446383 [Aulographum hederae CBS 113979]
MGHQDGTKVTTDPASTHNPIQEGTGLVNSDSLAAESLNSGGDFASGNAAVSSQGAHGSTARTTDTKDASRLDPASDAEARDAQQGWSEESQLNAGRGLGKEEGRGPTYNTPGFGSGSGGSGYSGGAGYDSTTTTGAQTYESVQGHSENLHPAPTYANAGEGLIADKQKPHGKNITEGGFDDSAPNASFNNAVGTSKDPGREGEAMFGRENAQFGGDAGNGPRQGGLDLGHGGYENLKEGEA